MKRCSSIVAFATLLIFAPGAFADSMTFTNPGSNVWAGVYVNPYTGLDTNTNQVLTLYCDDYNTEFSGNPTWDANIAPLVPGGNFLFSNVTSVYNFTLDNTSNDVQWTPAVTVNATDIYFRYLEAAYLFGRIHNTMDATTKQQLSAAAWSLFVNSGSVGTLASAINNSDSTFAVDVANDLTAAAPAAGTPATPNDQVGSGWYV